MYSIMDASSTLYKLCLCIKFLYLIVIVSRNGVLAHSFTHLKLGGVNGFINTDNDGSFKFQQDQSCYPKFHSMEIHCVVF